MCWSDRDRASATEQRRGVDGYPWHRGGEMGESRGRLGGRGWGSGGVLTQAVPPRPAWATLGAEFPSDEEVVSRAPGPVVAALTVLKYTAA